jgi:hypothetical protein
MRIRILKATIPCFPDVLHLILLRLATPSFLGAKIRTSLQAQDAATVMRLVQ